MILIPPLLAAGVTLGMILLMLNHRLANNLQDMPNARSLHEIPVPRIGGLGLFAGVFAGWLILAEQVGWWLWVPLLLLLSVSLLDDLRGVTVRYRLLAQAMAVAIFLYGSGSIEQGWIVLLVLLLAGIWMINLFNFMDGSNGLAGGMACFGFAAYAMTAWQAGYEEFAWLNACIVSASAAFLFFNFHPARVFMGDAGSIPMGLLVFVLGVQGWRLSIWPAWFPLLVFSPFIVDATVTLIKRSFRGEKVTEAHKEHYYQRLVQAGWSHRKLALAEYVLMVAAGLSAWQFANEEMPVYMLLIWMLVYMVVMQQADIYWRRFRECKHD